MNTQPAPRWRQALARALRLTPDAEPAPIDPLRALCRELVADLGADERRPIELFIDRARCAEDIWHLRSQLFGVISLRHGEHVARERLRRLDAHAR
jgi:hypothetical protein